VVVIYSDTPGDWGAMVLKTTPTAIPALTLSGEQGAKLAALAARGDTKLLFRGTAVPAYTYEVLKTQQGISAAQQYRVDSRELATVDSSFYSATPAAPGGYARMLLSDAQTFIVMTLKRNAMPRKLTEYVSTGVRTFELVSPSGIWEPMGGAVQTLPRVLQPGQVTSQAWNKPVVRSAITPNHPDGAVRIGELGGVDVTALLSQNSSQWVSLPSNLEQKKTTVYRDGQLLGSAPASSVSWPMVPQQATYKLVLDVSKQQATSNKVNTAWTSPAAC
jgi:hypothetical protein